MAELEQLKRGTIVKGLLPSGPVTVIDVSWFGSTAVEVTFKDSSGKLGNEILYRDRESSLEILDSGRTWTYDADGNLFRLVSEAHRIHLAHLFDPLLAVHTSNVEPLPHQITAVYGEMLTRQPLRFLLADDPGAGKTIMAGLLIKELLVRGDLRRCLICCPGNLVDQWQDELRDRFQLYFNIVSNESIENSRTGNPYSEPEYDLCISRLDHMSRNESILEKLQETDWDLVVVDEAHKMAAHFYGKKIEETKRYQLGKIIGAPERTRHFLLMTATPHNGKEEDFQLFMALLDEDRFEGKFRDGVHIADTSDLMRRMVKEQLVKFDNTPLFPERKADTVSYELSEDEKDLYDKVTEYVREEMNRADKLAAEGQGRRGNRIGFALTTLQRRLASSPQAIYRSIKRRRERLEKRIEEVERIQIGYNDIFEEPDDYPNYNDEYFSELEDAPDEEVEEIEDTVVEQASAARTIAELEAEIVTLKQLEKMAYMVRKSGTDRKWEDLSELLQATPEMFDPTGRRRKLIIFTEHKDTLYYLVQKIRVLLGRDEAVVTIHGGLKREERKRVQEEFTNKGEVVVLVATDAAGEGINLQRANLVINYDLPWNPNRLEQRFGRVHRIGQTEICCMWSMVATQTREGEVFHRLLEKLKVEREALGGRVFDVMGEIFEGQPLRKLLIEAIRYGDKPEVREKLTKKMDTALDRERLEDLLHQRALSDTMLPPDRIREIREDMERAEARKLQPHFIRSFFLEAFKNLGGSIHQRETRRYEVKNVPALIRNQERRVGTREVILNKYDRICFEKDHMNVEGKPPAAMVCPGHPLLDATILLIKERYKELLRKGAILVDANDFSDRPRALFYLEDSLQDARTDRDGNRRVISRRMHFVEIDSDKKISGAGYAPYHNYDPITPEVKGIVLPVLEESWLSEDMESLITGYAVEKLMPRHLEEVRRKKEALIQKTKAAVQDRLTKEINFWDKEAIRLKDLELAGKAKRGMTSGKARLRADELQDRLKRRMEELDREGMISPAPPVVIGGALVIPQGLVDKLRTGKEEKNVPDTFAKETERVERLAVEKVMETEKTLGYMPEDVGDQKLGYDIESKLPDTEENRNKPPLRFIEVKGRIKGANTVTITKNEILTGLNKPEEFILAIVSVEDENAQEPVYIRNPFGVEPDFGVTSVNYKLKELLLKGGAPS